MRERSLLNDKSDEIAVKNGRNRQLGICVSSEFYQPSPKFFTREDETLPLIGMYRGASVFIISNGPSLIQNDLSLLKKPGVITYGLNNGPKTFRPNLWSCVDDPTRFLKSIWLDPAITKFIPIDQFEKFIFDSNKWETMKTRVGDCPNVIGFKRNQKFMADRWLWEDTFNWGNSKEYGGGRSVLLPVMRICFLLGFRKVYLMGVDFDMSQEQTYHFEEQRTKGAVNCNMSTYKKMNEEYFPQLKPYFDNVGFNVYNCNPKSGLTVFPYVSYEDAINDVTGLIGDTETERTYGLYCDASEKEKLKTANPAPINLEKNNNTNITYPQPPQPQRPQQRPQLPPPRPQQPQPQRPQFQPPQIAQLQAQRNQVNNTMPPMPINDNESNVVEQYVPPTPATVNNKPSYIVCDEVRNELSQPPPQRAALPQQPQRPQNSPLLPPSRLPKPQRPIVNQPVFPQPAKQDSSIKDHIKDVLSGNNELEIDNNICSTSTLMR